MGDPSFRYKTLEHSHPANVTILQTKHKMEGGTYKESWQTKEVLDPGIESDGSISIIENIFEYTVECVYHFILTNHASKQSDIEKLLELYGTIEEKDKEFAEKVLRVQQNCEPNTFREITK